MKALPVFFASLLLSCATAGAAQMPVPTPAPPPALQPAPTPPPPSITGSAWLLMDYATGQVLAGDNIDARVEPDSITKVMTSYVAAAELKAGKIHADDPVTNSENTMRKGGDQKRVAQGKRLPGRVVLGGRRILKKKKTKQRSRKQ